MICENSECNKEHDGSFGSGRFCCRSCANSRGPRSYETREKISKTITGGKEYIEREKYNSCQYCGKVFKTKQEKKYCNHTCQQNYQYEEFIKNWKEGKHNGFQKNGYKVSNQIRRYLWIKHDNKCSRCGWDTPNPITGKPFLEIEHIDGDYTNNRPENLDLICPNCHSLTTTYRALNYGKAIERQKYFDNSHRNKVLYAVKRCR